jgi:hypothetical protein
MAAVKHEKELIDRYVYAVTSKLPAGQRADIERELRGLIEDMREERSQGGEEHATLTEEVLTELGHPANLAAQYRETKRYLIGPELFDSYWVVLKVVGILALVGVTIAFGIQLILNTAGTEQLLVNFIVSLFEVGVYAVAWVTIVFAIMEYSGLKAAQIGRKKNVAWHPSKLPSIPDTGARIRISSSIVSMMFYIFFFVIFVYSNLFGVFLHVGTSAFTFIPFWDQDVVRQLLPFFYGLLALFILREAVKLFIGQWTAKLAIYTLAVDAAIFMIYVFLFADQSIWNPSFMNELLASGMVTRHAAASTDSYTTVSRIWDIIQERTLLVIALAMVIENAVNFYRAAKSKASTKEHVAG